MSATTVPCQAKRLVDKQRCAFPAKYVIRIPFSETIVCGTHARAYVPSARQPIGKAQEGAAA